MTMRNLAAALTLAAAVICPAGAEELSGRLGYLQGGAAWVAPLGGGEAVKLVRSEGATMISLSPKDAAAYFFVPVSQKEDEQERFGYVSSAPYAQTSELPAPLQRSKSMWLAWSRDGSVGFFGRGVGEPGYRMSDGQIKPLSFSVEAASRDGKVLVHGTAKSTEVWQAATGKSTVLFSIGKPQALLNALRRAKPAGNLKALVSSIDPDLLKSSSNWSSGQTAISPDGRTVYFTTNAGTGMGAAGNTTWCVIAADVKTGKLTPLAKLGTFFGRSPMWAEVSPDGKKLLLLTSLHNSAASNPCAVSIVDLATEARRELLWADKADANKDALANLVDGVCWSPDSRHVAASVLFYDSETAFKDEHWSPKEEAYTLNVYDAGTAKVVHRIAGGHCPSWSR